MFALAILAETDLISALPKHFVAMHAQRFGVVGTETRCTAHKACCDLPPSGFNTPNHASHLAGSGASVGIVQEYKAYFLLYVGQGAAASEGFMRNLRHG